jgi:adenosine deaminase
MFSTDLTREYLLAARTFDLTREQILHLGQNAIGAAFLPEEEKLGLLSMMPPPDRRESGRSDPFSLRE